MLALLCPCQVLLLGGESSASPLQEVADIHQDVQEDSVSEVAPAGPLPPPRRVRGKSSPVKPLPFQAPVDCHDAAVASSSWEMDFSKYGVPDLDEPSSPILDFKQVPVEFVHDAEPLDDDPGTGNSTQPPVISQDFVTLRWAEPLANRNADGLRLSVMQAVAKRRAFGLLAFLFYGFILIGPRNSSLCGLYVGWRSNRFM